ncbi:Fic family protein [Miltoncostaea marina]|uniref:Fic family protein n=1 Tax=Miltoncostaea marina TaxID=2843215 RepID=UPI001C3CBA02|nr:Fic family protein [Miltoncostaea marina]
MYAPPRYRRACEYDAFVPEPLSGDPVSLPAETAGVLSEAERAIGALNARAHPALQPLARLLLRTESIASSKVEGLQVDARGLARAEARRDLGGRVGADALEVLANVDAMQLAVEESAESARVELRHLLAIHASLMRDAPAQVRAGEVRAVQNWIGGNDYTPCGAAFVPPPPERLSPLLDDLMAFSNGDDLPPLLQAALAHAQFETIHPFADGNGRTGRALVHVLLRRRELAPAYVPPISVVLARDRAGYIAGLGAFREGDVAGWVERFSAAAAEAAILASAYLDAVERLQDEWRAAVAARGAPRSQSAVWSVIAVLPAHPVVSVPVATAATGRSKPAVNQAVADLAAAGVLIPLSDARRNRSWEARGLLDLLSALEEGRPLQA